MIGVNMKLCGRDVFFFFENPSSVECQKIGNRFN